MLSSSRMPAIRLRVAHSAADHFSPAIEPERSTKRISERGMRTPVASAGAMAGATTVASQGVRPLRVSPRITCPLTLRPAGARLTTTRSRSGMTEPANLATCPPPSVVTVMSWVGELSSIPAGAVSSRVAR